MNDSGNTSRVLSPLFVVTSWLLVVLWAGLVFFMSSNTGGGLNEGLGFFSVVYQALKSTQMQLLGPGVDAISSIAHFSEYAVFGALLANALRCHLPLSHACLLAIACASLYGITDEIHQLFVPDRMCDPLDWLVDTAGAIFGTGLACLAFKKEARHLRLP